MQESQTTRTVGKKRAAIAAGSLLGVAALITAAAFTDSAFLNFGNGAGGEGIGGGSNSFNVKVVSTAVDTNLPEASTFAEASKASAWQEASDSGKDGVTIGIKDAETMTPGDTIQTSIPFLNASPKLSGELALSLAESPKTTSSAVPAGETKSMADLLRYTITVKDAEGVTTATYTDLAQSAVKNLDLGDYDAGDGGSVDVSITWSTTGVVDPNNYQGNTAAVQVQFVGTSL